MRHFMLDRRVFIATLAITCLTAIGLWQGQDVSMAIAGIAGAIAAANAYQRGQEAKGSVYRSET